MKSKQYRLKIGKTHQLWVVLNPFLSVRTTRAASPYPRLIIPVYLLLRPTKEIELIWQRPDPFRYGAARSLAYFQKRAFFSMLLLSVGFIGLIYYGINNRQYQAIELTSSFAPPAQTVSPSQTKNEGLSRSIPTHIKIKRIGVDAPIMQVGQAKDKTIEVPPLFENITGWYKYSPTPGEVGPAIIVGHVDTYKGPSVFYGLKDLKPGDAIEITREDKTVVKFKVIGLKQFEQNRFPTQEVYGNINHAGLRLITCGGTFNNQTLQYSANTVVFATIVS